MLGDSNMKTAPIVLFVYNRPVHTRWTVEALLKNKPAAESELFIFSDAPKKPEAVESVREVREYIRTITGFKSVAIVERDRNWGLANSIIDGVTSVVNQYGRVIVLEDDLVTTMYFLEYMNTALERYQEEDRVMQVSGHVFPIRVHGETDAVFLPMTTSWGWATWARAWQHFDPESLGFAGLKADGALRKRFNLDGAYDYFSMLEAQLAGRVDSWAVRWYLSVFMRGGLTLFPVKTLVENFGFDGSGTHCGGEARAPVLLQDFMVNVFPPVVVDEIVQQAINSYLIRQCDARSGLWHRLARWMVSQKRVVS
jgi:hypothetical protein